MAIVFVGGVEGSAANGGNVTLDLTALTGGAGSAAATGDVVIVLGAMSSTQTVTIPAAYISLVNATSTKVGWKEMGPTPDTSVIVTGSGSGTNSTAGIAFVYRAVDTASLLATTTTGTSTNPDPPSVATITPNAVVVAGFRTAILDTSVTAPTGYAHQFDVAGDDNNDVTIGMADITVASPSTEDPAAWTGVSSAAWQSFSIRIHEARPQVYDVELPDAFHIIRAALPFDPPNLQATTLVPPVQPPFFGLVLEAQGVPARLPPVKEFDPPDLTIGTLSLPGPTHIYRAPVISQNATPRSAAFPTPAPNLLSTLLAPLPDRPKSEFDWPKPALAGIPRIFDPPNLAVTTLAPVAPAPFFGIADPRPEPRRHIVGTITPDRVAGEPPAPVVGTPFFGTADDKASVRRRIVGTITPDRVAGEPPPAPPAGTPFFGATLDKASVRQKLAQLAQPYDTPNLSLNPRNFLISVFAGVADKRPPVDIIQIPNTLVTTLAAAAPEALPGLNNDDWPNPAIARAIASAPQFEPNVLLTVLATAPGEKPFHADDWPLPYPSRRPAIPYEFQFNPLLFEDITDMTLVQTLAALTCSATLRKANWTPQSGSNGGWSSQSGSSGTWTPQSGSSGSWTPQ